MTSIETAAAITSAVVIAVGAPAAFFHRQIATELRAIRDKFVPHATDPDRVARPASIADTPAPIAEPQAFPAVLSMSDRPTPTGPVPAPAFEPDPIPALKKDGTPKAKPGPKPAPGKGKHHKKGRGHARKAA